MPRARLWTVALSVSALISINLLGTPAHAALPTAAVALGDSFASGEAGRWQGNSLSTTGSIDGTDRSYASGTADPHRVYGTTYDNACDRSDTAPIRSAALPVTERINLACSGATTANVFRASSGGVAYKGEAPQADQLAAVARAKDVRLITLTIGGNDLGFADIITACVKAYMLYYYCNPDQQAVVDERIDAVRAGVGKAVDEIRAVMSDAGYSPSGYTLIVQSSPSPVTRAATNRYGEYGWTRTNTGGCPFWNGDLDWARDSLTGQLADMIGEVAADKGARFLDLRDAFEGREVCATASRQVDATHPASGANSEWVRWLVTGMTSSPGDKRESFHPNAYGQQALGRCLALSAASTAPSRACRNTAGQGPTGMTLS
ncbi:GDSL-type esterase/lipase family protein [Longispora sp. K20-0274]|uniref:GDSL-type esterase/lipase family protein n=1 Tax=Longispora sp. K20-0274 TaxID=3088255 RepID=UPI00399B9EBF